MTITSYTKETIIIREPSEKMLALIERMRDHKSMRRAQMNEVTPQFVINV